MKDMEAELYKCAVEQPATPPPVSKPKMTTDEITRHLTGATLEKYEEFEQLQDCLLAGRELPSNHKLLQDMRKKSADDPRYLVANTHAKKREFEKLFFGEQLEKIVKTHVHTQSFE